jgi:hypothetical protein
MITSFPQINILTQMKKITLSSFLLICISVHAQFNQVWQLIAEELKPIEVR